MTRQRGKESKRDRIKEEILPLSHRRMVVNGASFCSNLQITDWKQN